MVKKFKWFFSEKTFTILDDSDEEESSDEEMDEKPESPALEDEVSDDAESEVREQKYCYLSVDILTHKMS